MCVLQQAFVLLLLTAAEVANGQSQITITQDPSPFILNNTHRNLTLTCHVNNNSGIASGVLNFQWNYQPGDEGLNCQETEVTLNTCTFQPQVTDVNKTVECTAYVPGGDYSSTSSQLKIRTGPTTTHKPRTEPPITTTTTSIRKPTSPTTAISTTTTSAPPLATTTRITTAGSATTTTATTSTETTTINSTGTADSTTALPHRDNMDKDLAVVGATVPASIIFVVFVLGIIAFCRKNTRKMHSADKAGGASNETAPNATFRNDAFDDAPSSGVYSSTGSDHLDVRNPYDEIKDSDPDYLNPCYVPGANAKIIGSPK